MSSSEDEVLAAAEALGEALDVAQSETTAEFESLLIECNEAISDEIGLEYGDVCGAGSDCC